MSPSSPALVDVEDVRARVDAVLARHVRRVVGDRFFGPVAALRARSRLIGAFLAAGRLAFLDIRFAVGALILTLIALGLF